MGNVGRRQPPQMRRCIGHGIDQAHPPARRYSRARAKSACCSWLAASTSPRAEQNVGRLDRAARASRAARDTEALADRARSRATRLQCPQNRDWLYSAHASARPRRYTSRRARDPECPAPAGRATAAMRGISLSTIHAGDLSGCAHRDNARSILRPGAPARLVPSADTAAPSIDSLPRTYSAPTPFGPLHLVRADRVEINTKFGHVHGNTTGRLNAIGMHATHRLRAQLPRSRAIGWTVPISLLTCITEIKTVFGRNARRISSGSTMPTRIPVQRSLRPRASSFRLQRSERLDVRSPT